MPTRKDKERRMMSLKILPSVRTKLDEFAAEERRSRSGMIEHLVFRFAELHPKDRKMLFAGLFVRPGNEQPDSEQ